MKSWQPKAGAVLLVAIVLVAAQRFGVLARLAAPSELVTTLVALGPWGYVAFVAAYATLQPFGVPGTVFIFAAPLIWPWPVAFALSMTGTMAASVVGFVFARFVARDFVAKRIPARFRKYDAALEERAFMTVFLLRLIFWMPPLLHAFFGVSKVRFRTHFWASFLGYIAPLLLVSYFGRELGQKLIAWMKNAPPSTWVALGAATIALGALGYAWTRKRREKTPTSS